jgi:hypothetical protein
MTFTISVGTWGGFYFRFNYVWRICLGWIAFTIFPFDIDVRLNRILERDNPTPKEVMNLASEFNVEYKWWPEESNLIGGVSIYNSPAFLSVNFYEDNTLRMHREDGVGMNYTICDEVDNPTIDEIREAIKKLVNGAIV